MRATVRTFPALAALAALAGCVSFGSEPPESLLTLTPTAAAPAGSGASGSAAGSLAILVPEAPARLDVVRVPVQIDGATLAYLKDAVWVDKPARLFRTLLAETIRTRSGRVVIDSDDPALTPSTRLRGVLRDFGYDASSSSVVVRFDAIRETSGRGIETRRFESVVPGVAPETAAVGPALNRAANDVAGQVADWVG
ncbi:ABC-type transport auxiliary lipoprotein family protein [Pelagerythrobacter marensis]|uniref:ABC-type transport auxiliary lipoprotein family protein n=1 Tax=Pelagerythrobacter marensis TaxID=543877 RepID=A0ABZ2D1E3_9SPHN